MKSCSKLSKTRLGTRLLNSRSSLMDPCSWWLFRQSPP